MGWNLRRATLRDEKLRSKKLDEVAQGQLPRLYTLSDGLMGGMSPSSARRWRCGHHSWCLQIQGHVNTQTWCRRLKINLCKVICFFFQTGWQTSKAAAATATPGANSRKSNLVAQEAHARAPRLRVPDDAAIYLHSLLRRLPSSRGFNKLSESYFFG